MNKNTLNIALVGAVISMLLTAAGVGIGYFLATNDTSPVAAVAPHPAPAPAPATATAPAPATATTVHPTATGQSIQLPATARQYSAESIAAGHAYLPAVPPADVQKFAVGDGNVKSMVSDGSVIWVGSSFGLIRYDAATDKHEVLDNSNSPMLSNGIFYLAKIDDTLWVGTYGGGLHGYDGQNWKSYNIPHGLGDAFIYGLTRTPDGDVWIATWSGANRVRGGDMDNPDAWELYTVENTGGGLPNDWVYAIDYDSSGNVWLGTEGGIARYDGSSWQNWKHEDGLGAPYEQVKNDLIKMPDSASGKSQHHARQKVEMGLTAIDAPFNPNYIVAMTVDDRDRVWLGTWGGGLSILENGQFRTFTTNDGLPGNYISMLVQGPDGTMWIGSNQGLTRTKEADNRVRFANYSTNDGLYSRMTFSMAFPEDNSVWVGSYGGATHYPNGMPQRASAGVKRLVPGPPARP